MSSSLRVRPFRLGSFTIAALASAAAAVVMLPASAPGAFAGKPGLLAFQSDPGLGSDEIFTMNSRGGSRLRLTAVDQISESPSWSPDGRRIVFERFDGADDEIFVINANGSGPVQLTNNAVPDNDPAFTRDGRIVWEGTGTGGDDIMIMNANGSGQTNLTNTAGIDEFEPAPAPDGKKVYYERDLEVFVMNFDGSGQGQLTFSGPGNNSADPDVSPDSRQVVFTSNRLNGSEDVWIMNANGTSQRQVTFNADGVDRPVFSPDGKTVAFEFTDPSDDRIATVSAAGGPFTVIPGVFDDDDERPDWQPIPVNCGKKRSTLVGTPGRDKLIGTPEADVIAGLGGNDKIKGLGGKDRLCGGKGKDKLIGGPKPDRLFGGKGPDILKGGGGKDVERQ